MSIHIGTRVYHPDHPEYGFGTVKLIEESLLDDQSTSQVSFDWMPGLTSVPETSLQPAFSIETGGEIPVAEWGGVSDLQSPSLVSLVPQQTLHVFSASSVR